MKKVRLSSIAMVKAGGTPSRSNLSYWNGDIPWVKISDIQGKHVQTYEETITEEGLKNSSAKLFSKGTILYTIFATLGRVGILDFDATTNQAIAGINILDETIDCDYLYYFLRSQEKKVKAIGKGVAQQNINLKILRDWLVPIRSKEEQTNIAGSLEKIEGAISAKNELLNSFDSLVKSRFMEMFTNVDKRKLSEMAEIIMGQSPDSKSYNESGNGVPFFQGKGDFGEKYTKIGHWTTSPTKTAKLNDVLMSVRAPVGPVNIASTDCCIGRGLCAIRAENGLTNSEFLYNALKVMEPEIALMGNGSTFKAINKKDVYSLLIPVASTQSQESFSKFASLIDKSRFVVHSRYFLWLNFTFVSSTIAYSRVVSILECPKRC